MNTSIDLCSKEVIAAYQSSRLMETLSYVSAHSPYYKALFAERGIDIRKIKAMDDLRMIPTTDKETFGLRNFDFLCVSKDRIADYCTTSGTTGAPMTIAVTAKDLERLAYNEYLSFKCADGKAGDVYQLMLTLDRQFMAGMAYFMGIQKLGGSTVRVGPGSAQMQWENIQRFKPTAIVAVPSFIVRLIAYAEANQIDLNGSSVKKAICIGEPLRDGEWELNALSRRIMEKWDIALYSTYASTEMQTAFTECGCGAGGHLQPELIIAEITDEEGHPLPAGVYGEVTITTLGVEGMPLLRYKTGDICAYYDEPCKCGRQSMRLSPVRGRKNQMIKYKGTTLYPPSIYDALATVPEIQDYLIQVYQNELGTDEVLIYISQNGNHDSTEQKIKTALQSKIRVIPELSFVSSSAINEKRPANSRKPIHILFKGGD